MPTRCLINQCQIITFLILKSDNIENSRIDLKGIILQVPSNQIKVTFIILLLFLPSNLVHLWYFFLFHIEIEGKCGWIIGGGGGGGGGGQRVGWPPRNYWEAWTPPPPPPPSPSSYAYVGRANTEETGCIPWTCYTAVVLLRCNIRELYSLSFSPTPSLSLSSGLQSQSRRSNQGFSSLSDKTKPRAPASIWPNWYTAKKYP